MRETLANFILNKIQNPNAKALQANPFFNKLLVFNGIFLYVH